MRFLSSFAPLGGLAVVLALAAAPATAQNVSQTFKPASAMRHYDKDGKTYFRGPHYVTLGVGASYYNGDLSTSPATSFYNPAVALGFWYRMGPRLVLGIEGAYVKLASSGIVYNDYDTRELPYPIPISFENTMYTLTGFARYNLIPDRGAYAGGVKGTARVMPFLQTGLGVALIDPQTFPGKDGPANGAEYLARERADYPSIIGTLPVGAGLTFQLVESLSLTLDATYHFTLSDSLDDVDYRGTAGYDSYATAMAKLGFAF